MRWKAIVAGLLVLLAVAVVVGVRFGSMTDADDGDNEAARQSSSEVAPPRRAGDSSSASDPDVADDAMVRLEAVQDMTTREALALWVPPDTRPAPAARAVLNGLALRAPDSGFPQQFLAALLAYPEEGDDQPASLNQLLAPWARPYLEEILADTVNEYLRPVPGMWQLGPPEGDVVRFLLVRQENHTELVLYLEDDLVIDLETISFPRDRGHSLSRDVRNDAGGPSILP